MDLKIRKGPLQQKIYRCVHFLYVAPAHVARFRSYNRAKYTVPRAKDACNSARLITTASITADRQHTSARAYSYGSISQAYQASVEAYGSIWQAYPASVEAYGSIWQAYQASVEACRYNRIPFVRLSRRPFKPHQTRKPTNPKSFVSLTTEVCSYISPILYYNPP